MASDETEKRSEGSLITEAVKSRSLVRTIGLVLAAIAPSLLAYTSATGDARNEAAAVKDKAESGYQFTRDALKELREKLAELDRELAALRREVRRGRRQTPPPAPIVAPPAAPLPADLDKALKVQQAKTE